MRAPVGARASDDVARFSQIAAALLVCGGCAGGAPDSGSNPPPSREVPARAASGARIPDGWLTSSDPESGVAFHYPPDLGTTYIQAHDWPPEAVVISGPFECTEAGAETARAGRTERLTIEGTTYCVTRVSEGAAGSIYTQYAYAMSATEDVVILTFSVRAAQCGNYPAPHREACEAERASFSMDSIVHRMASTLRVVGRTDGFL